MNTEHDADAAPALDRQVLKDTRDEALPFNPENLQLDYSRRQILDPKITRELRKKLPPDEVGKILSTMTEAIAAGKSLILHSTLPNSIRFPAMRTEEGEELPEVILAGAPLKNEIDQGKRFPTDNYRLLGPLAMKRIVGDHTFLNDLVFGLHTIVDSVPELAMSPVQRLSLENDRLRARLDAVERQLHPLSAAESESARRAALTDEEREKEDDGRRRAAAASGNGPQF
jgi:hypothetical protein